MEENDNGQPEVLPSTPLLSGRMYEWLKFVVTVLLPAAATMYLTLGDLWDFPRVQQVVGTMTALAAFLGLILKVSSVRYYKNNEKAFDGVILVDDTGFKTIVQTQHTVDPRDLANQAIFKVVKK